MDLAPLVLRAGTRTAATGRVVAYAGQVRFEPPLPVPAVGYAPGSEPPPRPTGCGVAVDGVDLSDLAYRREKDGGIEGWAALTGTWSDERLVVSGQRAAGPGGAGEHRRPFPRWDVPPGDPPQGGWPAGRSGGNPDPAPPGDIPGALSVTVFRPRAALPVLVVATTDPTGADELLRPMYGDGVQIVGSRWTPTEVQATRRGIDLFMDDGTAYTTGQTATEDGQVLITAEVVRVTPELADWARSVPDGLLDLAVWLSPSP
jgi:hypothetical protein